MLKKLLKLKEILFKIFVVLVLIYSMLIGASLVVTGFLFFTFKNYTGYIQNYVYNKTGYILHIGKVETKLNTDYLPELLFNDVSLSTRNSNNSQFSIKSLDVVFSYATIWNFQLIFNRIAIDGTSINLVRNLQNQFLLNGININQLLNSKSSNVKNSFDIERWLLLQDNINLTNLNFSFDDKNNDAPIIVLHKIGVDFSNSLFNNHSIVVQIANLNFDNVLQANLKWRGGKFEDWQKWSFGEFNLKNVNRSNDVFNSLKGYLADVSLLNKFNSNAFIVAKLLNGKIQYIRANFGINNFNLNIANNANVISFPHVDGNFNLELLDDTEYKLTASNFTICSQAGCFFDKAQIQGNYKIGRGGKVSLNNTNLVAFNNIFRRMLNLYKVTFYGNVDKVSLFWSGSLLNPKSYNMQAKFSNIMIKSQESAIPSINNLSGDVNMDTESGTLKFALKNSSFYYPELFFVPFNIISMNSKINWVINPESKVEVNLLPTVIQADNFKINTQANYVWYLRQKVGYIDMTAHLDKIKANLVEGYLPRTIGDGTHKWLHDGIKYGYATNASMILKGDLAKFPFESGDGLFYITSNIENIKLNYLNQWPNIESINGQFILKNQSIKVLAKSANVLGNSLVEAWIDIPDYTSSNSVLIGSTKAVGSTQNFISYLKNSPLNQILGHLPESVITEGNGNVNLSLNIPLQHPESIAIDGKYDFLNNQISFINYPIPDLKSVHGILNFNSHGLKIDTISFNALGSKGILRANTDKAGTILFNAKILQLDYYLASKFYLPIISNVVKGEADTDVQFSISKNNFILNASSWLNDVKIDAPSPIGKNLNESREFLMSLKTQDKHTDIKYSYSKFLQGVTQLDQNGSMLRSNIIVNDKLETNPQSLDKFDDAKINIQAYLMRFNISDWISFVNNFFIETDLHVTKVGRNMDPQYVKNSSKVNNLPIGVVISTNNAKIDSLILGKGNANLWINDHSDVSFNFNFNRADGYGAYDINANQIKLSLNNLRISKLNSHKQLNESQTIVNYGIKSSLHIPYMYVNVDNLFYKNRYVGALSFEAFINDGNLTVKDGSITNDYLKTKFDAINYCFNCVQSKQYSNVNFNAKFNNLGEFVNNLNNAKILEQGKGDLIGSIGWYGGFDDFTFDKLIGSAIVQLYSGKFLQVNTGMMGSLLGGLLGIINLQAITQIAQLEFNNTFSSGFYFNDLYANVSFFGSKIAITQFKMTGGLANVVSNGSVNINNKSVDMHIQVVPKLGITTAVAAGAVTLNPFIGILTYIAEFLLGEPVSKLFGVNLLVTGNLNKPIIKNISVTDQVYNNINYAIGAKN